MSTTTTNTASSTAAPTTDTAADVSLVTPAPRSRMRRRLASIVVLLAAVLGATLAVSAPAEAYVNTAWSGRQGYITFGGAYGQRVVALSGYRFLTPDVIVYRNGAVDPSYQQEVQVDVLIQRWDGARWVSTGAGVTERSAINMGAGSAVRIGGSILPSQIRVPGYFRAVTTVSWGSSIGPFWTGNYTGHQQFVTSSSADLLCGLAACANYGSSYGALYVWG